MKELEIIKKVYEIIGKGNNENFKKQVFVIRKMYKNMASLLDRKE